MGGVREYTELAREYFNTATDYVAENLAEPVGKVKEALSSNEVPWVETGHANMGQREIPGSRSNKIIMYWAQVIGGWVESYYKNDDIPWCGLFVAYCLQINKVPITIKNPLSARAWLGFGNTVQPCFGAIMVFSRKGGGHVGFYVSEDKNYYHILGGNQSNKVSVAKVAKSRFLGARWPKGYATLYKKNKDRRIWKTFDGEVFTDQD
jgi:uncharacterized protein (TIGR02594 family)